jgi:hypothetical protein
MIGPGEDQWQTVMVTDGPDAGRVAWIPPKYIDPDQQPRINRAHHVDETVEATWQLVIAERHHALQQHEKRLQIEQQKVAALIRGTDPTGSDDSADQLE